MPSNLITINYSKELEWIVPDSKMEKLVTILNDIGDKHYLISSGVSALPCSQIEGGGVEPQRDERS